MEGWKIGRLEGWKRGGWWVGRVEGGEVGRGRREGWKKRSTIKDECATEKSRCMGYGEVQ